MVDGEKNKIKERKNSSRQLCDFLFEISFHKKILLKNMCIFFKMIWVSLLHVLVVPSLSLVSLATFQLYKTKVLVFHFFFFPLIT